MTYARLIRQAPMIGSAQRADELLAELHVLGLTIVPTCGYYEAEMRHDPLCEAMRPDDVAPLLAHAVDP